MIISTKNNDKAKKILFIITIFVFSIGICCIKNMPDNDLWARIIAGAYFTEFHTVIKHDFLSYTPTHIWYDHEWGASVIFYNVFKYFGAAGLIVLKGILLALTVFFCYLTVNVRKPQSTISYNILYYVFLGFCVLNTIGHTVRCLMFTCLFFSVFIYILERARLGKNKTLILLPFLMILWCNIHGGCMSGLGILAVYAAGEFLNGKEWKKYVIVLVFCLITLFINPYGCEYVKFLFAAACMKREYITEWLSPFYSVFKFMYLKYKFCLVLMLLVQIIYIVKNKINYKNLDKTKLLILLLMTYLSVFHIRHINFFVLTAGTLFYDEFYELYNALISKIKFFHNEKLTQVKEIIVYSLIMLIIVPAAGSKKVLLLSETDCPRYAIEFVKINNLKGNLFINFDWGSYAAYKLYPDNLIPMDGRYEEVYDPDLLLAMKDFHLLKNDWEKMIRDYKTDVMILERKYPVYKKIMKDSRWKLVFQNNLAGVFVPADKYRDDYIYPVPEAQYYDEKVLDTDIDFVRVTAKS